MRSSRPGRRHTATALRLAAVAVVALAVAALAPGARAAPRGDAAERTAVTLVAQTPWVGPNGTVLTRVRVDGAPADAQIQAVLHTRLRYRSSLAATFRGENLGDRQLWQPPVPLASFIPLADGSVEADLAVGFSDGSSPGTGRAVVTSPGVFPLELRVLSAGDEVLGRVVTYAVRLPAAGDDPPAKAMKVAAIVPLAGAPGRQPDGSVRVTDEVRERTTTVLHALQRTTAGSPAEPRVPLTLAPDPELLDSLRLSAEANDRALLTELAGALGERRVLSSTYVPLDLPAWVLHGNLVTALDGQLDRGDTTIGRLLHRVDDTRLWAVIPRDGRSPLTPAALDWLTRHGFERLVLPEGDLEPLDSSRFPSTLTRPFQLGSGVRAVQLDESVAADLSAKGALGANRAIADLAMVALDRPSADRGLAFALDPSQRWDPATLQPLVDALARPDAGPGSRALVEPVDLGDLFELPSALTGGDRSDTGDPLVRSLGASTAPDELAGYAGRFSATAGRVADLARMLGPDHPTVVAVQALVDTSGAVGLPAARRAAYLDAADALLANAASRITLPARQTVTLTSRTAVIPVTIRSQLDHPADVVLHLDSSERLEFPDGDVQPVRLEGEVTHLRIRVRTRTPGDATLRLRLTSPQGDVVVAESRYTIHSTAASGVGLFISIAALAFLLLWWIRNGARVRRQRRAAHIRPADLIDLPSDLGSVPPTEPDSQAPPPRL